MDGLAARERGGAEAVVDRPADEQGTGDAERAHDEDEQRADRHEHGVLAHEHGDREPLAVAPRRALREDLPRTAPAAPRWRGSCRRPAAARSGCRRREGPRLGAAWAPTNPPPPPKPPPRRHQTSSSASAAIERGAREDLAVEGVRREQLRVGAGRDHVAAVESEHALGERDRREPVGDHESCAVLEQGAEGCVDLLFDVDVDRAGRVVEDEDRRVEEQRPRDRHALALAARERVAALTDDRVVAVGEPHDELVGVRGLRGRLDGLEGGVRSPYAMLSRIETENRNGSSWTMPTAARSEPRVTSRTSWPSISTVPPVTS